MNMCIIRWVRVASCILLVASVTCPAATVVWTEPPPSIVPLNQTFYFEAYVDSSGFLSLYRNGVMLYDGENLENESWVYSGTDSSVVTNNTTFSAYHDGSNTIYKVSNETTPPSTPTNLATSNANATSVTLTWTASTDNVAVTGYELKYNTTSLGTATGTTRNVTGLVPNVQYSFTVRARDEFGNWSNWSSPVVNITLLDVTAPSTPGGFSSGSSTYAQVSLSWTASTDDVAVVAYDLYRTFNGNSVLLASLSSSTTTFQDTHVLPGASYGYFLKARDGSGNASTATSTVNVSVPQVPDTDADGIPDALETLFGISGGGNPSADSSLNLQIHRPSP